MTEAVRVYPIDLFGAIQCLLVRPPLTKDPDSLRAAVHGMDVLRANVREEEVSLSFEARLEGFPDLRIQLGTKTGIEQAFTHTTDYAARVLKTKMVGKSIHDLGSGNLAMSHYLLRTRPKRIVCYDKLYRDASTTIFKGDQRIQLKTSFDAERSRGVFASLQTDKDILFIGFPWTSSAADPLAQILVDVSCNAVIAMQNDATMSCGTLAFLVACLSRDVQPSQQAIGRFTSYATYLSASRPFSEWASAALEYAQTEKLASVTGTGLQKFVEFMLSFRKWKFLTFTEYCFLVYCVPSVPTYAFLQMPPLKVASRDDREHYYSNIVYPTFYQTIQSYRTYLGSASSYLGEYLNTSLDELLKCFEASKGNQL